MTLQELINFIEQRTGILLNERNRFELRRLLEEVLKTQDIDSLYKHLSQKTYNDALWQQVIQKITIGETYFFRNKSHMQALRHKILPGLIQQHRETGFKQLRIWSAGCSTGEEPYSLAMLVTELLGEAIHNWSISILATDINDAYLSLARHGVYTSHSFRAETEADIKEKWFDQIDEKHFQVKPNIQRMVSFSHLNLVQDTFPSFDNFTANMDLILCRNVTIYFEQATTQRIVDQFYKAVNRNGWLIVGHSEPNLHIYRQFEAVNLENTVAYRKPDDFDQPASGNESIIGETAPSVSTPSTPVPKPITRPVIPPRPLTRPLSSILSSPERSKPQPSRRKVELGDLLLQAEKAADSGKWIEALQLLEQIETQDKLNPTLHYLRGIVFMEQGKTDDALESLRHAIYCDADFIMAHYMVGDIYVRQQDAIKARHHWNRAKKLAKYQPALRSIPSSNGMNASDFLELINFRLNEVE